MLICKRRGNHVVNKMQNKMQMLENIGSQKAADVSAYRQREIELAIDNINAGGRLEDVLADLTDKVILKTINACNDIHKDSFEVLFRD